MVGQSVKPVYYRPSKEIHGEGSEGTTHSRPSHLGDVDEWILVDGTPASCVQLGLHHFFEDFGPIDIVISGPNYGRNTTAVFALSSGTLGGAMEAAVCKRKAVALSFAFFTRNHDPVIIEAACRQSVRVIEALYKQWPGDDSVDLYSVNVPLVEGVEDHKILWTDLLQNYWRDGSCFEVVGADEAGEDPDEAEERIREEGEGAGAAEGPVARPRHRHKQFKWAPRFSDVYKSVEEAPPGNDGWAVKEGYTRYVATEILGDPRNVDGHELTGRTQRHSAQGQLCERSFPPASEGVYPVSSQLPPIQCIQGEYNLLLASPSLRRVLP